MNALLRVIDLDKSFTLHHQGGARLDVLRRINLSLGAGECVALDGPSGAGKSTLLRAIYANYLPQAGHVLLRHGGCIVDMTAASPQLILAVRRRTLGYVSQFLRAVPRVASLDVVAEPLRLLGIDAAAAQARAGLLLRRLNVPERLWPLAPATFSGGEQQRVNLARAFAVDYPILLLDEPTASLDAENRRAVIDLIAEARRRGSAILGIFHDRAERLEIATRLFPLSPLEAGL
jgi:alpha-D-ribose 1-methylphosphonate 5-triphosphate synthase subunit PhnL